MAHEATVVLDYKAGLHLRAAMLIVRTAQEFDAKVTVVCNGKEADGRSILKLMELCAADGSELIIRAEGADAEPACRAVVKLIESRFDEDPV